MSFGYFMYSHSLVPVIDPRGSGRDKVGIRALIAIVELRNIVLYVLFTTAAIRLSNIGFVIFASSILRWVCSIAVFDFSWIVFSEREVKHEMLLLLKQLMMLSSPFRMMLSLLLLDVDEEVAVVAKLCLRAYLF